MIDMKIYLNLIFLVSAVFSSVPVHSWVTPVDFNSDFGASNEKHSFILDTTSYDRCDTLISIYGVDSKPTECHRFGLLFKSQGVVSSWKPKTGGDGEVGSYRLPTIKELVRLFNYSVISDNPDDKAGLDAVIRSWIAASVTDLNDTWIVSSSYRDIDGVYDNGVTYEYLQVFALNAGTGEVKTFIPTNFHMCLELDATGACTSVDDTQTIFAVNVDRNTIKKQCSSAGKTFTTTGCP
jgi:hypothetical protein